MVALVLYAYATKQRSSRAIERHCRRDLACRVITGSLIADHATVGAFSVATKRRSPTSSARCSGTAPGRGF